MATLTTPRRVSGGEHEHGHLEELRTDRIGLMRRLRSECGDVGAFQRACAFVTHNRGWSALGDKVIGDPLETAAMPSGGGGVGWRDPSPALALRSVGEYFALTRDVGR